MKLKFSLKDIKKNIAGMTPAEAADYIWTYYKWHILIAAFIVIFSVSLVSAVVGNALSKPVLKVGVLDQTDMYLGDTVDLMLSETFPESTGYTRPVRCSITSPANENNPYGQAQLMAYLSAGELDAVLADQATVDYLVSSDVALQVTDVSATDLGKSAEKLGVSPFLYVIVSKGPNAENDADRQKAAARFLETIQKQ